MSHSLTPSIRHLYCIPPHTHALLRYRVQAVTPTHVVYFIDSGVTVDRITGDALGPETGAPDGPVRAVRRDRIDSARSWEGAPPEEPVFYSSVETYRLLHDVALARYGLSGLPLPELEEEDGAAPAASDPELDRLRRRMMDSHPDHGGTDEDFAAARAAYEAARRGRPRRT